MKAGPEKPETAIEDDASQNDKLKLQALKDQLASALQTEGKLDSTVTYNTPQYDAKPYLSFTSSGTDGIITFKSPNELVMLKGIETISYKLEADRVIPPELIQKIAAEITRNPKADAIRKLKSLIDDPNVVGEYFKDWTVVAEGVWQLENYDGKIIKIDISNSGKYRLQFPDESEKLQNKQYTNPEELLEDLKFLNFSAQPPTQTDYLLYPGHNNEE